MAEKTPESPQSGRAGAPFGRPAAARQIGPSVLRTAQPPQKRAGAWRPASSALERATAARTERAPAAPSAAQTPAPPPRAVLQPLVAANAPRAPPRRSFLAAPPLAKPARPAARPQRPPAAALAAATRAGDERAAAQAAAEATAHAVAHGAAAAALRTASQAGSAKRAAGAAAAPDGATPFDPSQAKRQKAERRNGDGERSYVPWAQFAAERGIVKPKSANTARTLLLAPPLAPPAGWYPRVHGLEGAGEQTELAKRGLEATRAAGALCTINIQQMLDVSAQELTRWSYDQRAVAALDYICGAASSYRLAGIRQQFVGLDNELVEIYGRPERSVLHTYVGAWMLKEYLLTRLTLDRNRKRLAAARKAARIDCGEGAPAAPQSADSASDEASGSAASALSLLAAGARIFHAPIATDHPSLKQFVARPPTREDGGAEEPPPLLSLHLELLARDPTHNEYERGSAAMAEVVIRVCARDALICRSTFPEPVSNNTAIGGAGADLKKKGWSSPGRPLVCDLHGASGDVQTYDLARDVLSRDGYNARVHAMVRAHNGAGGDPSKATRWLDREPNDKEWNATLRHLCALEVRGPDDRVVSPHLLRDASGATPQISKHSLKQSKACLYTALLFHTDYLPEATAHAGSTLERLSVDGATSLARRAKRPAGLAVALRYARAAKGQTIIEVEMTAYDALRSWIASTGLKDLPRTDGWAHLSRWSCDDTRRCGGQSLIELKPPTPAPARTAAEANN